MPAETRPPTMIDVARAAGVSHQTVSRYLRFDGGLKPATAERVATAIQQLGYRPNLLARTMRTGRSGRVAILMPGDGLHSPGRLIAAASDQLQRAGYAVDVLTLGDPAQREQRAHELCDSRLVDGVLSFAAVGDVERVDRNGVPIVSSGDYDERGRAIGGLANSAPVEEIVLALHAQGHRRFGHVTGDLEYASARARLARFEATVEQLGLPAPFVHRGDWSERSGAEAVAAMPARGAPSALLAANDVVAAAAIRAAGARGWRVPHDLSVTGWDDVALGALLFPALTTVALELEQLGAAGAARLLLAMRGETEAPSTGPSTVQRVVWRESTGPVAPDEQEDS